MLWLLLVERLSFGLVIEGRGRTLRLSHKLLQMLIFTVLNRHLALLWRLFLPSGLKNYIFLLLCFAWLRYGRISSTRVCTLTTVHFLGRHCNFSFGRAARRRLSRWLLLAYSHEIWWGTVFSCLMGLYGRVSDFRWLLLLLLQRYHLKIYLKCN